MRGEDGVYACCIARRARMGIGKPREMNGTPPYSGAALFR